MEKLEMDKLEMDNLVLRPFEVEFLELMNIGYENGSFIDQLSKESIRPLEHIIKVSSSNRKDFISFSCNTMRIEFIRSISDDDPVSVFKWRSFKEIEYYATDNGNSRSVVIEYVDGTGRLHTTELVIRNLDSNNPVVEISFLTDEPGISRMSVDLVCTKDEIYREARYTNGEILSKFKPLEMTEENLVSLLTSGIETLTRYLNKDIYGDFFTRMIPFIISYKDRAFGEQKKNKTNTKKIVIPI